MAFNMDIWKINEDKLQEVPKETLGTEERLENWIAADSSILGLDLLIIGRQVVTQNRGRIDLLAIDSMGDLVVLELKRDKTPRDVTAQVLDYATWVKELSANEINEIAKDYLKENLSEVFLKHFNSSLPDSINNSHSLIIVASRLDDTSERIVNYLSNDHNLSINVIFFNFFKTEEQELLGRSWLMDPEVVIERSSPRTRQEWSGFWYVNVGEGPHRNWEDCVEFGFLSAGQGPKYSRGMHKLEMGSKVFAYMKGLGYVGYGIVESKATMVRDYIDKKSGEKLLSLPLQEPNMSDNCNDPEKSEYVVGVKWKSTKTRDNAITFLGVFANQNIVCKLMHQQTLDVLKKEFSVDES